MAPVARFGANRAIAYLVTAATRTGSGSKVRVSGSMGGPDMWRATLKCPDCSGFGTTYGVWTRSAVQSMTVGSGDGSSRTK